MEAWPPGSMPKVSQEVAHAVGPVGQLGPGAGAGQVVEGQALGMKPSTADSPSSSTAESLAMPGLASVPDVTLDDALAALGLSRGATAPSRTSAPPTDDSSSAAHPDRAGDDPEATRHRRA